MCVSKAREWPHGWQMPGPCTVQNLQMPHPQDWQGGQMPHSSPVGVLGTGGIDWCIMHLSINGLLRMDGGGWGGSNLQEIWHLSITPPLGLHFESHFHPWGELIGTHNSLYCVNDIWNKSYMNCGNEMKMKKWSSQWTEFTQFAIYATARRSLKRVLNFFFRLLYLHKLRSLQRSFLHVQSLLWHWASPESNYYLVTK